MSAIAMVGGITIILPEAVFKNLLLPMISLGAGTLLGGAFFHMIPEAIQSMDLLISGVWLLGGFTIFLGLEQFLHWHHSHDITRDSKKSMTYLVLIGDAVHNFLGGLGIASTFLIDARAGIVAWFAAASHEIPQELGDFGILVYGGWPKSRALIWNVVSALTFPLGAILAYFTVQHVEVSGLALFAAGNFIYIAASDLIPEIKSEPDTVSAILHFVLFVAGLLIMFLIAYLFHY